MRQVVRAPSPTATETEVAQAVLTQAASELAPEPDEAVVVDRGFGVAKLQAAGVPRWINRVPRNFSARRMTPPKYGGKGRRPRRGALVRPLARTRKVQTLVATPPDRTETLQVAGRFVQAEIWTDLCLPQAAPATPAPFQCVVVRDRAYAQP